MTRHKLEPAEKAFVLGVQFEHDIAADYEKMGSPDVNGPEWLAYCLALDELRANP